MINISIVEDKDEVRNSLKTILHEIEGFHCAVVFSNAEEAIVHLPTLKPDVVIMDVGLPGMSGIDCVKEIHSLIPKTLILMYTVFEDEHRIFEALKAGASGYILKKTSPLQIVESIKELVHGGSPMSTSIARKVISFFNDARPNSDAKLLTPREIEVLGLLSKGLLYKEIAQQLSIAIGTVKRHLHMIYEKLHVQNKTEAFNKVFPRRVI